MMNFSHIFETPAVTLGRLESLVIVSRFLVPRIILDLIKARTRHYIHSATVGTTHTVTHLHTFAPATTLLLTGAT